MGPNRAKIILVDQTVRGRYSLYPFHPAPKCSAETVRPIAGIRISVLSRVQENYLTHEHPEDCNGNEIGPGRVSYPDAIECNTNGTLCISKNTGIKTCRCKPGYIGRFCENFSF